MKIHSKSVKLVLFICFFSLTLVNISSCEDYERSQFYDAGEVQLEDSVIPKVLLDTVKPPVDTVVVPIDILSVGEEEVIF